jgi:hypothetical protein
MNESSKNAKRSGYKEESGRKPDENRTEKDT